MALMRYVGPYDEVAVTVAGVRMGVVEQGGSLAVPDDVIDSVVWPEELWERVSDSSNNKPKGKTKDEGTDV